MQYNNDCARATFHLPYLTSHAEHLRLCYKFSDSATKSGKSDFGYIQAETQHVEMTESECGTWTAHVDFPAEDVEVEWWYELVGADGTILRKEQDAWRREHLTKGRQLIADSWTEEGIAPIYHHTAFTESLFSPQAGTPCRTLPTGTRARLTLSALPVPRGFRWGILGSAASLGEWQPAEVKPLQRTGVYSWSCPLDITDVRAGFDFKIVLINEASHEDIVWESGNNRHLASVDDAYGAEHVHVICSSPRIDVPRWRGAGVVIPVFSLRSKGSWGIGDFGDLRKMVRWAASVGMRAVQILPVNDTTRSGSWYDSYPYSSTSVFALNPMYLDPREWEQEDFFKPFRAEAERLNRLESLDYESVFGLKDEFVRTLYKYIGARVRAKASYRSFVRENEHWLRPYADFRASQKPGGTPAMHIFTQYLLHEQLSRAHDEARQCGVILKGDIPIGISRDSVPARTPDRRLFNFDGQAGAPPDFFSRDGQNWGFPTYNWEEMAKDGYAWWRRRFENMSRYFDAYRIDHVLGFFRIWEIPIGQHSGLMGHFRPALPLSRDEILGFGFTGDPLALSDAAEHSECEDATDVLFLLDSAQRDRFHPRVCGQWTQKFQALSQDQRDAYNRLYDDFFYYRHNEFWASEAMKKLPTLIAPNEADGRSLLPCAEDLGMVPASVKGVLERLSILSLEIQTMPKTYGVKFADLMQNPYLSVSTFATHDMPPFRMWWEQDEERARAYWHEALHHDGEAPHDATPTLCEEVVRRHLECPSMLCLLALQDWLAIDGKLRRPDSNEQINIPADPSHHWKYRMHLTLEELFAATAFNEHVLALIRKSGR